MENEELLMLNPDDVVASPYHRRQHWGDMKSLTESVADLGVLQPCRARRVNGHIELIFGHRRRLAAKMAGKPFPVLVGDMPDETVIDAQITENLEREDMHPMDEAELFAQLLDMGLDMDDVANRRGCELEYVRSPTTAWSTRPSRARPAPSGPGSSASCSARSRSATTCASTRSAGPTRRPPRGRSSPPRPGRTGSRCSP